MNHQEDSLAKDKAQANRLINEKSPYLLQHAYNPVSWYAWSEEAFQKAKEEDKPVFLSIGYSTCHWCHVMERESFEDEYVAKIINTYFVPIKVDREERPDIDGVYMSAVQAMAGQGGWPLTVFLTPDKKPFFGGTYFPPYAKWGSPGLLDIMESIHHSFKTNRGQISESSQLLVDALTQHTANNESGQMTGEIMVKAYEEFAQVYDHRFGGFGHSPKFPSSHNLSFLLRHWLRSKDDKALKMVEHTLTAMAQGGMYDHLGGGFHRYATDQQWQIPHFEKMLYDQAILARTYLEAYQITKNKFYADVAREIFDYVLREMTDPQGGFYCAQDADSLDPDIYKGKEPSSLVHPEKKEGAFYIFKESEIKEILGQDDVAVFNFCYGIKPDGNAHTDPHGEFTGKNIIFLEKSVEEAARHFKKQTAHIEEIIKRSKEKLYRARLSRPHPHLDDKVLTDWNGLMISSLAFGARVLNEEKYQQAAQKAAEFILNKLTDKTGRLLHRYRDGTSSIPGMIEDYAFFIHGLLDLYEATFEVAYLESAINLCALMSELFWDKQNGGFNFTASDAERLIFQQKEIYDGAIPSGNSMAALGLLRLYHLTVNRSYEEKARKIFEVFAQTINRRPSAYAQMMIALDFALGPTYEIVIASVNEGLEAKDMLGEIYKGFVPNKVVLWYANTKLEEIRKFAPFVENQKPLNNKPTAYVCQNHVCQLPTTDIAQLREMLTQSKKR